MLNIGTLKLASPVILAPMAGITSLAFRRLNRKYGCEFAFLEMVNARSLGYGSKKTKTIMDTDPLDKPLGVQLLGDDTGYLLKGLDKLKDYSYQLLDFNAACPQKKITSRGQGAALLKEPRKLKKILKVLVAECPQPVSIKMRLGWETAKGAVDIAKSAEEAGVRACFVHGRNKMQGYSGNVDYSAIEKIKKALSIPVIASGDIFNPRSAQKMLKRTGCDAVLVARGALGNPWIFRQIKQYLETKKEYTLPDKKEVARAMREHFGLYVDYYGEAQGVIHFRKFFIWYTRGYSKVRCLRRDIERTKTDQGVQDLIERFYFS